MTRSRSRRTSLGVLGTSAVVLGVGPWLGPAPARPPTAASPPAVDHVAHGDPADDDSSWPLIAVAAIAGTGVLVTIGGSMALYARKRLRDARLTSPNGTIGAATTPDPAADTDNTAADDGSTHDDPSQTPAPARRDPTPGNPAGGTPSRGPRRPDDGRAGPPPASAGAP